MLVEDIVEIFSNYDIETRVLAASIRNPLHCVMAAKVGAHIATLPYSVLMQMFKHPSDRRRSDPIPARLGEGLPIGVDAVGASAGPPR